MNPRKHSLLAVLLLLTGPSCLAGDHVRLNPEGLREPVAGGWSNIVISDGAKTIHVAGLTAKNASGVVEGIGNMEAQVAKTLSNIRTALAAVGATPEDVVRVNIYTLNMTEYLRHGYMQTVEFWNGKAPASTLVGVSALADPDYLVEIEVTAVVD